MHTLNLNLEGFTPAASLRIKPPTQDQRMAFQAAHAKYLEDSKTNPELVEPAPPGNREMSNAELVTDIIQHAFSATVKKGSVKTLKKINAILFKLRQTVDNGGIVELDHEEYRYLKSKFDSCEEWQVNTDVVEIILHIDKAINAAQTPTQGETNGS